jgi:site-specific DNA recombinase
VTGGKVFGYTNHEVTTPDGRRSHVERRVNEKEAAVVRRVFALASKGMGFRMMAHTLNEQRAIAPRSQQGRPRAWAPSSVRAVLYRRLYIGEITWGTTKKRDSWGRKHSQGRPEAEWLRIPAPHLRIVSDEQWSASHSELRTRGDAYLRGTDGKLSGAEIRKLREEAA